MFNVSGDSIIAKPGVSKSFVSCPFQFCDSSVCARFLLHSFKLCLPSSFPVQFNDFNSFTFVFLVKVNLILCDGKEHDTSNTHDFIQTQMELKQMQMVWGGGGGGGNKSHRRKMMKHENETNIMRNTIDDSEQR